MTDPTSADKVLVALAERASKRRSQIKREERKEERIEESVQQNKEQILPNQRVNSKPKKVSTPIKEEFLPVEVDDYEEYPSEESNDYDELPKRKSNSFSNYEGSVPVRKARRNSRVISKIRSFNPENADTFEEQVNLVGNLLCDKLSAFQSISALKVTQDWIDCIVDENDSFYEEIYNKLILLNKEQLLGYIRILVSTLK